MTIYPSAVIVVNNDLTQNVQDMLIRQLMIDEVVDGYSYDVLAGADGYYNIDVRKSGKRILIIRSLDEEFNRDEVDIVAFISHGLIAIEKNKFGPHGFTWPIVNLTWGKLGVYGFK